MTEEKRNEIMRRLRIQEQKEPVFGDDTALYGCTFENDSGGNPKTADAKRYAEHFDRMYRENIGLIFWGQSGNGKTFAAASIANAVCEAGREVRMLTLGAMLTRLPCLTPQEKEDYMKSLTKCDLLVIDDFGMERRTDYAQEQVYALINGRYLTRRPLVVTTNLSLERLKNPVDLTEQRIFDRVLEMCVPVCFDGPSMRRDRGREKLAKFRELTK